MKKIIFGIVALTQVVSGMNTTTIEQLHVGNNTSLTTIENSSGDFSNSGQEIDSPSQTDEVIARSNKEVLLKTVEAEGKKIDLLLGIIQSQGEKIESLSNKLKEIVYYTADKLSEDFDAFGAGIVSFLKEGKNQEIEKALKKQGKGFAEERKVMNNKLECANAKVAVLEEDNKKKDQLIDLLRRKYSASKTFPGRNFQPIRYRAEDIFCEINEKNSAITKIDFHNLVHLIDKNGKCYTFKRVIDIPVAWNNEKFKDCIKNLLESRIALYGDEHIYDNRNGRELLSLLEFQKELNMLSHYYIPENWSYSIQCSINRLKKFINQAIDEYNKIWG